MCGGRPIQRIDLVMEQNEKRRGEGRHIDIIVWKGRPLYLLIACLYLSHKSAYKFKIYCTQ